MTVRAYLWGMGASTILCFVSWVFVITYIDPTTMDFSGISLFYLSLFFFMSGLFALLGFYVRRRVFKEEAEFVQTGIAFRQGVLLSLIFTGDLVLQNLRMLTWLNVILLVLGIGLMEVYFMSKK